MSEYEKYTLDYKLVFGQSVEGISEKNAYLSFIRIIHRDMPLNTIHMVSDEDMAKFDRAVDILKELEDIQEKQDLDDERVLVYCQPVFNLRTRTFDTAEALMRMKLPFDIIKFDRSLVIASETDVRSREVVRSLASIFAGLDYAVLYEGIENDADEKRCMQMSASYLQGYKYSKPIPIGELRNLFSKAV